MDYSIDQARQPSQRVRLLGQIFVAVVHARDAADGMTHDALAVFTRHASTRHQRACGAPQIVQAPRRHVRRELGIKVVLVLARLRDVLAALTGEHIRVASVARQRFEDGERGRR